MSLSPRPERLTSRCWSLAHRRRELHRVGDRVARFQRRDDALGAAEAMERGERLVVGDADVFGAADVLQVGVLGADAGVVEAGRDRVRLDDLAVVVLQQVGAVAVQHARADRRRSTPRAGRCARPWPAASTPISRVPLVLDVRDRRCPSRCCRRRRRRSPRRAGAPIISGICTRHSSPITLWKSRTIVG